MYEKSSTSNDKSIKEYIYIDETEVNSVLAQLKDGIPQVIRKVIQTTSESNKTDGKGNSLTGEITGKIPRCPLSLKAKGEHNTSHQISNGSSDMKQKAIDTVYSDHAIDIIENELESTALMKAHTKQPDGKFVKLTQKFTITDFSLVKKIATNAITRNSDFNDMKETSEILQELFPRTIFVKLNRSLVICDEENFRYNKAQLQAINFSTRKITVIGRVETIFRPQTISELKKPFISNSINSKNESTVSSIEKITPVTSMHLLHNVFNLKVDDRIIKPIAMYFK